MTLLSPVWLVLGNTCLRLSFSGFCGDYIPKKMLKLVLLKTKLLTVTNIDLFSSCLINGLEDTGAAFSLSLFFFLMFSPHVTPVAASGLITDICVCVGMELIQTDGVVCIEVHVNRTL